MTIGSILRHLSARAAALVVSLGCAGAAAAADQPAPTYAAPTFAGAAPAAGCPTCGGGAAAAPGGCATCGPKHSIFHKPCKPYVPHLCPGACFGYFQTQWHRWENVCPIPYQGVDLSDAPPRATPPLGQPVLKGSDAPLPAPKPVPGGPMPMIPMPGK